VRIVIIIIIIMSRSRRRDINFVDEFHARHGIRGRIWFFGRVDWRVRREREGMYRRRRRV